MRIASILFASLVAIAGAACGGSSASQTTAAPERDRADDPSCPVAVAGTSVTVEDTDRGAALAFVTTGDVAEVRKRAAAMASMHNEQHAAMGPLPTGDEAGGGHDMAGMDHGDGGGEHGGHAGGMISVHSQVAAEDIDGGARLVFTAMPDDVGALQDELRQHAQHMSSGTCSMSSH